MCLMAGRTLPPEIAGTCNNCSCYLSVCMPVITDTGMIFGECDSLDYCDECVLWEDCYQMRMRNKEV